MFFSSTECQSLGAEDWRKAAVKQLPASCFPECLSPESSMPESSAGRFGARTCVKHVLSLTALLKGGKQEHCNSHSVFNNPNRIPSFPQQLCLERCVPKPNSPVPDFPGIGPSLTSEGGSLQPDSQTWSSLPGEWEDGIRYWAPYTNLTLDGREGEYEPNYSFAGKQYNECFALPASEGHKTVLPINTTYYNERSPINSKRVVVSKVVEVSTFTHNAVSLTRAVKRKSENTDLLVVDGDITTHNGTKPEVKSKSAGKRTRFLVGNCTSFSQKVKEYIIAKRKGTNVVGLLETHEKKPNTSFWDGINFEAQTCLAKATSDKGTHGGETIGFKKTLNARVVPQYIWDIIKQISPVELCWAAIIITVNKSQLLFAIGYLNVGEELSTNNIHRFQQLVMLRNILNLPMFAFGDFNIDSKDMIKSGLLEAHSLKV